MNGGLVAISAVVVSCGLYVWIAHEESKKVLSVADFLPLRRYLSSGEYRGTTVAAGMSLATVVIALINLAPAMGISLMVTVVTYCLGFVCLLPLIPRIMEANNSNRNLPEFLGATFASTGVQRAASTFTLLGYLSIFAMELLVGVTVVEVFFPNSVLAFAFVYFIFLVTYTWLSGFRGVVATDLWQLRFIVLSILALIAYLITNVLDLGFASLTKNVDLSLFTTWKASAGFCLGIAAMNIPAPISDAATWQRLCSVKDPEKARSGLLGAIGLFVVLWGALILVGSLYAAFPTIPTPFDPGKGTLVDHILRGIAAKDGPIFLSLLFLFFLGFFSAMVSTADSLLLAATHILLGSEISAPSQNGAGTVTGLRKTRLSMLGIASVSFLLFVIFRLINFNVVQLVFAIYGAQLALFPATFVALMSSERLRRSLPPWTVVVSISAGFTTAWGFAIAGQVRRIWELQFYAPVGALVVSVLILSIGLAVGFSRR